MFQPKRVISLAFLITIILSSASAAPDPNFHIFLCFGQSNMAGGNKPGNSTDCDTTSSGAQRVKVLAFMDCNTQSTACTDIKIIRTANVWYTAFPPYNNCSEGIGPSDYFGKTLIDSVREDIKIGFIPCALSGQDIGLFQKGNTTFTAPTWAHPTVGKDVYAWMIARCKIAQQSGVLKGLLFHQGETNAGDGDNWVNKVVGIVDDLKADLGLSDSIPFIAGELLYASENGCCSQLNPYVNKLPSRITNCAVVSANGLKARENDEWRAHFDTPSMRELGVRYATAFLKLANNNYVPRLGEVKIVNERTALQQEMNPATGGTISVYTLHGRRVRMFSTPGAASKITDMNSQGVYIVSRKLNNGQTAVFPFFKE